MVFFIRTKSRRKEQRFVIIYKMASLYGRTIFQVSRRTFTTGSFLSAKKEMPHPLDLATGRAKKELLAILAGNDDPFMMNPIKRGAGTKDQPNVVPSAFSSRMMGCVCEEDSTSIAWMWLHEGTPKRCSCGHWFKLERRTPAV